MLLRLKRVVDLTGLSKSSIYAQMQANRFPRPVKIASSAVAWKEEDIRAWIDTLDSG